MLVLQLDRETGKSCCTVESGQHTLFEYNFAVLRELTHGKGLGIQTYIQDSYKENERHSKGKLE